MTRVSTTVLTIVLGIHGMSKREIRTQASTSVLARVLCVDRVSKGHEKTTIRTQASTGVLARVLRIDWMSKGHEKRTYRTRVSTGMLTCVLRVDRMSKGHGKKDVQDMGEHRHARSCPAHPWDVEGTWNKGRAGHRRAPACSLVSCTSTGCQRDIKQRTYRTQASTGVLARALGIRGMLKRQRK